MFKSHLNLIKFLILSLSLMVGFEIFLSSCASQVSPNGGPRDTTAPKLDTSFPPNYSINMSSKVIIMKFNEYISLKSAQSQILISPPIDEKLEFRAKNKELLIQIDDELKKNTTYTISFGEAVTDFTEGNANGNLKYVFSTGSYLDSLKLGGTILESSNSTPIEGLLIALYKKEQWLESDSCAFLSIPDYYTFSDKEGKFTIENIAKNEYKLVAFENLRSNFKLTTYALKSAFQEGFITPTPKGENYELRSFMGDPDLSFKGAKQKLDGSILITFNKPNKSAYARRISLDTNKSFREIYQESRDLDTIIYWSNSGVDSMDFEIGGKGIITDTVRVRLNPIKKQKSIKLLSATSTLRNGDTIRITSPMEPLIGIDSSNILLYTLKDTLNINLSLDSAGRYCYFIPEGLSGKINIVLLNGGVKAMNGMLNDSSVFDYTILKGNELGQLDYLIKTEATDQLIFLLKDPRGKVIHREKFRKELKLNFKGLIPGNYQSEVIVDTNNDSEWTNGSLKEERQAERIIINPEKVEIRANWDLEYEWLIKI